MEKYQKKNITFLQVCDIKKYFDFLLNEPEQSVIEKAESHPVQVLLSELLFYVSDLSQVPVNKGSPKNNPVKESIKLIRMFFPKFSSIIVYCMQAGLLLAFMPLLNDLQARFMRRKRMEGVLTFNDLASLSRTILLEQKDIRQSEKESFKAIMIDEFQDNNELQKDLLFLLAEKINVCGDGIPTIENMCPDKLFFVGDEKQSIYLFRGADVSVFRKLKNEIKSANLPLRKNYRSVSGLIGAFNALFGGSKFDPMGKSPFHEYASVFAPENSPSLPLYEATYTPLEADKEGECGLSICILNGKDEEEIIIENEERLPPIENEARYVAEKIKQLLNEKTQNGEQKFKPKDIAILFRAHTNQYIFEKHLRLLDIPYTSENINDLFYSGVVNDIIAVLRLAAHPLDSASYAEMLRSPFVGLSLSGTAVCLSLRNEEKVIVPFSDDPLSFLDNDDREKYLHGQKIYTSICGKAASESISSLVSELWYNEGYRYETEWHPNTSVFKEYYDYLFLLAVRADNANQGLAVFTEYILHLRDCGERLKDITIPLDRPGAVNLLTIHKSKGLEFPVVFICCCGKKSRGSQGKKIYDSNHAGIVFSPPLPAAFLHVPKIRKNFFWEQVKTEEGRKDTAELRRLLYVAMTRAEQKLFLTGVLDISDNTETDNFSLKIKNHINKIYDKYEKEEKIYIEGDSIINNDSLFGMLLPAISSFIPQDGRQNTSDFFNIEVIPVYTEGYLKNQEKKDKSAMYNQDGLNEYIEKMEKVYEKASVIKTPILYDNHLTPTLLQRNEGESLIHTSDRDFMFNKDFSGTRSDDIFNTVDTIVLRLSKNNDENSAKFSFANFGTIAHISVEALLNKQEVIVPANIAGLLKPSELTILLKAGWELANRFILSPLGVIAQTSKLRENEFSFRSIVKSKDGKEFFINGTIDLFFEDTNNIHIVDFKTDAKEVPEDHFTQMTCYFQAVSALFPKKPCRVWLYYLRTGNVVEIFEKR
jgi:ATP-dependent helicase/nuclease subunit A